MIKACDFDSLSVSLFSFAHTSNFAGSLFMLCSNRFGKRSLSIKQSAYSLEIVIVAFAISIIKFKNSYGPRPDP